VTRALVAASAVLLLVGCAKAFSSAFSDDAPAAPTQSLTCGPGGAPPVPLIRASRDGDRIWVEYEVLARPTACRPDAIRVIANSVDKLDNIAPSTSNGLVRLTRMKGTVELKLPPLDLPPYEARAATVTPTGRRSATTTVRIPESGDYCRRTASASVCIARAQAKFMRCLRGDAPRSVCPDYVWRARPLIPYEPLQGVTHAALERSFELLARKTEHGGATFELVLCSSLRECVVTWRGYGGIFRARFEVSGYGQRPGCWIAERRAVLAESPPPDGMVPLRHLIADRQSACVHWEWDR
jgi:hypothetical protein